MTSYNLYTKYGSPAKDQRVSEEPSATVFYSYGAPVAGKLKDGTVELYPAWNYSATTNYYRGQFLGENTAATRKKLASGEYHLAKFPPSIV